MRADHTPPQPDMDSIGPDHGLSLDRRRMLIKGGLSGFLLPMLLMSAQPVGAQSTAPTPPRILVFGDSLTEGFGLSPRDGLVPSLGRWLRARGHVSTLRNAGLSGDTTYGGRVRINWSLRRGQDAVIIELGANDLLMGWAVADIEKNLDVILDRAKAGGRPVLLVGIAPPDDNQPKAEAIRAMWQRLALRHDVLLIADLYAPIWASPGSKRAALLQKDGLHLSAKGVDLVVDQLLGPKVIQLLDEIRPQRP